MSALPAPECGTAQLDASQIDMLRGLRNGMLLNIWLDQAPPQLRNLQDAISHQSLHGISTIAHSFKSASYSIGARQVGEACGELGNALQLFSRLQQCFLEVQPEVERLLR